MFESNEIGFTFERAHEVDGYPRVMGSAANGLATIELIGPSDDIVEAYILVGLPNDDQEALVLNSIYMAGMLNLAVPGWDGGVEWLTDNLVKAVEEGEVTERRGGLVITLYGYPIMGMVGLKVEAES